MVNFSLIIMFLIIHDLLETFNGKQYVLAASSLCLCGWQSCHVLLLFVKICRRPQKP